MEERACLETSWNQEQGMGPRFPSPIKLPRVIHTQEIVFSEASLEGIAQHHKAKQVARGIEGIVWVVPWLEQVQLVIVIKRVLKCYPAVVHSQEMQAQPGA
jgi:hypothetical protein